MLYFLKWLAENTLTRAVGNVCLVSTAKCSNRLNFVGYCYIDENSLIDHKGMPFYDSGININECNVRDNWPSQLFDKVVFFLMFIQCVYKAKSRYLK